MKTKLMMMMAAALMAGPCFGQPLKVIEREATAATRFYGEKGREMNQRDINDAMYFLMHMAGFTSGLNASCMVTKKREELDWVYFPDDWMKDMEKTAPSFLAFIRKNKPDGFKYGDESNIPMNLYLAWYLTEHSKSNQTAKLTSAHLIKTYFSELNTMKEGLASAETDRDRNYFRKKIQEREARKSGEKAERSSHR